MFDTTHILYMAFSALISVAIMIAARILIKTDDGHVKFIRFFAVLTVVIHYSSLWVDFFSTGTATVQDSMLLPIYPCNICMWLLLIWSFVKNREGLIYRILTEYVFWAGTVCGTIGILLNENYASTPSLADYEVLKGLLSHSTMVIGCVYVLVAGFARLRVRNVISVTAGLIFFIFDGIAVNTLFSVFKLDPCNSMYLLEPPFPDMPWLTNIAMGIMAVALVFVITAIYEQITLPKEERWYSILKEKFN